MQTKEQMKNWKFVASVATVAALGVSGYAIASTTGTAETPAPIDIDDQRTTADTFVTTTTLAYEVVPAPSISHVDPVNSPTFDTPLSVDSPVPVTSRASVDSPASVDTPPRATAPAPDSPSPDSPTPDSPKSPDTADSPESTDSPSSLDS